VPKLLDFGLARRLQESEIVTLTKTSLASGPECRGHVDEKSISLIDSQKGEQTAQTGERLFSSTNTMSDTMAHANPENAEQTRRVGKRMDECNSVF
jgi:hypothetical protein